MYSWPSCADATAQNAAMTSAAINIRPLLFIVPPLTFGVTLETSTSPSEIVQQGKRQKARGKNKLPGCPCHFCLLVFAFCLLSQCAKYRALNFDEVIDAARGKLGHRVHLLFGERLALRRALYF